MSKRGQRDFALEPEDNVRLANLCGPTDEHLRLVELRLGVEVANRGHVFRVTGDEAAVEAAEKLLRALYEEHKKKAERFDKLLLVLEQI